MKRVLIIGNGGREHAIGWSMANVGKTPVELYFSPGNPGTAQLGKNLDIPVTEIGELVAKAKELEIDLTVVGPELPLSIGIVDAFQEASLAIFGPSQAAAELESSKRFAKEIMASAAVPTGRYEFFQDAAAAIAALSQFRAPYVIKSDGLAAGKGVVVTPERTEAEQAIRDSFAGNSGGGSGVLVEEFLSGREVSYIVMTDGTRVVPFPASNDYKRIFDGDRGANTGGMGTVSPTEHLQGVDEEEILEQVIHPVLSEMKKRGIPFVGFLYAGLMISEQGEMNVVEFNARMGDPEAQVLLRRYRGDLFQTLYSLTTGGSLQEQSKDEISPQAAVCVVLASHSYPQSSRKGDLIHGIEAAEALGNIVVFQAGTEHRSEGTVTAGGRVLGVTALGDTVEEARLKAYDGVEKISFDGQQYRTDIAASHS
ncbi:phosphoribosylamine--glycine ligase [bacterium]|nr:phosphoribosylamine--glycine ligase [bacterium]